MSFTYQLTKKHIQGKPKLLITKIREKVYPKRYANITELGVRILKCIDPGGSGWEIAEQLLVDPNLPNSLYPEMRTVK